MPLVRTTSKAAEAKERGRAAFLDAAERLVGAGASYSEVAIGALAAEAGFSRASFYAYFSDKRALADGVVDRFGAELGERVDDWLGGIDTDPGATIADTAEVFERHRGAVLLAAEAASYDPEIRDRWRLLHARFEERIGGWIARHRPGIPEDAVRARAFALAWSTQSVLVEHLTRATTIDPQVVGAVSALWRGALAPGA
ncbi:TetR/AcrR family transcriptional regulator [Patulibacter brassicae]|uniref:TetR/AcrR family transcriptional regulator n=1 Tax=Patulibacter brassicae TaxID=1705717 RepID=A0ABU4VIK5_9ACTN|nr:TetR/AcrR family transcriptional regulator [Patulibacter brassicae]MDX8151613.1 TetR/AcrR family transcriptional regulator [Patulibacter brassicae]